MDTKCVWENMKATVEYNRSQDPDFEWPQFLYEVFFTEDTKELLGLTKSPNQVISALARSRVLYDGEAMGIPKEVCEAMKE